MFSILNKCFMYCNPTTQNIIHPAEVFGKDYIWSRLIFNYYTFRVIIEVCLIVTNTIFLLIYLSFDITLSSFHMNPYQTSLWISEYWKWLEEKLQISEYIELLSYEIPDIVFRAEHQTQLNFLSYYELSAGVSWIFLHFKQYFDTIIVPPPKTSQRYEEARLLKPTTDHLERVISTSKLCCHHPIM